MLYNMPGLTKVWFDIETIEHLANIDSIIGVKDSSGDLEYFARLCKLKSIRPDWSVLIGPEASLPEAMALGGDGGVAGGANVLPQLFVDCYQANNAGDGEKAAETIALITSFSKFMTSASTLHDISRQPRVPCLYWASAMTSQRTHSIPSWPPNVSESRRYFVRWVCYKRKAF